jgi:hypothetical protein
MIDFLISDPGIVLFSCAGLLATAVSIVRDTRSERDRMRTQSVVTLLERQESAA